jgi:LuxR family maltose regulon positive regulatory protein
VRLAGARGARFEPLTGGREAVLRPRLLDRLRQRFAVPLTVVTAPAGYGKTTVLAQALEDNRMTPRGVDHWLSCGADDGAASSLAAGLCRAIGAPAPADPGGAVEAVNAVEAVEAVEAVAEAMWHGSPAEVAVILDDVHEIPEGSAGADLLAALVAELPRNGHLVLSGRAPLPIALARADVHGQVLRIAADDLLFTGDELADFAARRRVPGDRLASSGGWPALAEMAATALPGVEAAYLWEEVLGRLAPARRRALALLAHVGPFDEALAAAALGHDVNDVDLAALVADLPLVGLTAGGGLSVHGLWRPFLAGVVTEAEVEEARRRAGLELARTGEVVAAVRLLTEAGAWGDVTRVVIDALGAARQPVPGDVVAAWLGRLPEAMREGPVARLLSALTDPHAEPSVTAQRLEAAAAAFRDEGELAGELACLAQLGQLAWWWERPERMAAIVTRVIELDAGGHHAAAPLACLARALVADLANDCAAALAELDRIPPGSFSPTWQSTVDWVRSTSLNHLGRPAEALVAAEQARANAGRLLHAPLVATARLQAMWFLGRTGEVVDEFPPVVERTAATGLRNYEALVAATCCVVLSYAGRPEDAAPYLEQARAAASPDIPLVGVNLAIAEAALAVAQGDEARAAGVLLGYLAHSPLLGTGHTAAPQQRTLALWYVLVPDSRPTWDSAPLGPSFVEARHLARRLVSVKAGERAPGRPAGTASGEGPADGRAPEIVPVHLPLAWATEFALADIAAGQSAGWSVLDHLWPTAQPHVRRHAERHGGRLQRPARAALGRLPVPPAGRLELRLLGPVELRRDGVLVDAPEWRRERVRSLLAHLVLHRSVSRERLASDLWPALDVEAQSSNLRVTLSHLLRVLEPERGDRDASFLVRPHGGHLVLEGAPHLGTDVWRFDALWEEATDADGRGSPSAALGPMREAVALWRGDPADLAAEDWALGEVEERRIRVVSLAVRAGELLLTKGALGEARQMGETALTIDPWSERAHHVVVAAHTGRGDERAVRRALARYRDALEQLGLDPAETERTVQAFARSLPSG